MTSDTTYCVDGQPATFAEYTAAERDAGFNRNHDNPDEPATYAWSGIGSDGQWHRGHAGTLLHRSWCRSTEGHNIDTTETPR